MEGKYGYGRDPNGKDYEELDVDEETGEPLYSQSYRDKYGNVQANQQIGESPYRLVDTEKGIHIADDSRGTKQREVVQELTRKQAGSLGDDVYAVNTGGAGRTNGATGVRVEPDGGPNAEGYVATTVTFANGGSVKLTADQTFDFQESLDISSQPGPTNRATFFDRLNQSRERILNHPGHADQKSHGRGGGVRPALSGHGTAGEVSAAAAAEAKRITGRDVEFALEGDPQIAAEHAEGVLRGLTVYPDAPLSRVQQGADGGIDHPYATTDTATGTISFATEQGTYRENLAKDGLYGDTRVATPTGVALHEFGHIVAEHAGASAAAHQVASKMAKRDGMADNPNGYMADKISTRAGNGKEELTAEAFSDVMAHGSTATELSKAIVDTVNESYGT